MEYLQETEINALLRMAYEHNGEHHLALLVMYATGTRVSQALRLHDIYADPVTRENRIRLPRAKRGTSRSYKIIASADPIRDLTPIIDLAKRRGTSMLFGGLTRHCLRLRLGLGANRPGKRRPNRLDLSLHNQGWQLGNFAKLI
jgi:integrase